MSKAAVTALTGLAKEAFVYHLMEVKTLSNMSFDDIAEKIGVCNAYAGQLFYTQAQLKPETAIKLKAAMPGLTEQDIEQMKIAPMRSWDDNLVKEPNVYRTIEACQHFGDSIKQIINEKFGDGIMSAIDFYVSVENVIGAFGEQRVMIKFNGKYLPYISQLEEIREKKTLPGATDAFMDVVIDTRCPEASRVPKWEGELPVYEVPATAKALTGKAKDDFVSHLHLIKAKAHVSFDAIAKHLGTTNIYAAQLINNQAQLKPDHATKLKELIPDLTDAMIRVMVLPPMRSWDAQIMKEPNVYRTVEACQHFGQSIKHIINEKFGDGIMSAIDFFYTVDKVLPFCQASPIPAVVPTK